MIFSLYKTKLVDLWVRQKCDQHILKNTVYNGHCNFVIKLQAWRHKTSHNDVEIKMADVNAKYFKVNLILIHVSNL